MERPIASSMQALRWCRQHNASVRFESNGTVSVRVNGMLRRRASLVEAAEALRLKLEN